MPMGMAITPSSSSLWAFQKNRRISTGFSRICGKTKGFRFKEMSCLRTYSFDKISAITISCGSIVMVEGYTVEHYDIQSDRSPFCSILSIWFLPVTRISTVVIWIGDIGPYRLNRLITSDFVHGIFAPSDWIVWTPFQDISLNKIISFSRKHFSRVQAPGWIDDTSSFVRGLLCRAKD